MITVHVDVLGERKRAVTRRLRHAGALKEDSPSVFVSQPPVDVELQPTVGEEANMIDQLHLGFHRLAAKRAGRVHVDVRPLRRDGFPRRFLFHIRVQFACQPSLAPRLRLQSRAAPRFPLTK